MPCVSGCFKEKCTCSNASNCIIRIRSLYRGGFEFRISTETTGEQCINEATRSMGISNDRVCFFGLQHESFGEKYWLDNNKSIFQQLIATAPPCTRPGEKRLYIVLLRLRFFGVPEPLLDDDIFRTFLFYQLKSDFAEGKLTKDAAELTSLSAYLLHYGSLTLICHALPGVEFEKKLASVLPKHIRSVNKLIPYVHLALKVISNLTTEQTKLRFINQCQLLPHYGVERFAATLLNSQEPYLVYFSCSGIIIDRYRVSSRNIIEWDLIEKVCAKDEILQIEFHPRLNRRTLLLAFPHREDAQRAADSASTQQNMARKQHWKRPLLRFHPLVHVPRSMLLLEGESDKLSAAIKDIFALSSDDLSRTKLHGLRRDCGRNSAFFPYASEANICLEPLPFETDAFSLRSSGEESTLPLIYGSVLAQSTPVLRHHSSMRAKCASAANLPHKKRLAVSRPLVNSTVAMDQSTSFCFFSSQPSINQSEWTVVSAVSRNNLALSNPHLARRISETESLNMAKNNESQQQSTQVPTYNNLAESDRCFSLVFPRSVSSNVSESNGVDGQVPKFKSECVLDKKTPLPTTNGGDIEESADDLTALPTKSNIYFQAKTLPASFKRRTLQTSRVICLELIQKLHNRPELEQEYSALPSLDNKSVEGSLMVDSELPTRFLVHPDLSTEDFESEEFWASSSNIVVLLNAKFLLLNEGEGGRNDPVISLFQSDVVTGDNVGVGQRVFLSLFSVSRSPCCHIFGVHVKFAQNSPHRPKTVWLFCWIGEVSSQVLLNFGSFVDEIVATDISNNSTSSTLITVSSTVDGSLAMCSLYIAAHVLLRNFRVPNHPSTCSSSTMRSVFDTVSAIRRLMPCAIVSLDEYMFLYELLLRWLEKPPRLI